MFGFVRKKHEKNRISALEKEYSPLSNNSKLQNRTDRDSMSTSKVSVNDDNSDSDNASFFDPPLEHYASQYMALGPSNDNGP